MLDRREEGKNKNKLTKYLVVQKPEVIVNL